MSGSDMQPVDITGDTLEEAISNGLMQLGLSRNEVIIEIIEEGSRGLLGMGARQAHVRLIPLRSPRPPMPERKPEAPLKTTPKISEPVAIPRSDQAPQPEPQKSVMPVEDEDEYQEVAQYTERTTSTEAEAQVAREALTELLGHMGIHATIKTRRGQPADDGEDDDIPWVLNIQGRDLGILIGRRGETLNALQFIARLVVSRELQQRASFVIDVEGYKSRRENTLRSLARRMAEQARRQRRTMTLEPMPPNERRIIHLTLRDDRSVHTESVGTGDNRKVTIIPVDR